MNARSYKFLPCVLLLLLQLLCAATALAEESTQKSFLWEIRGPQAKGYLFGTVHVGRSDFFPLPPAVEESFAKADGLAVEVDTSDPVKMQAVLKQAKYQAPDNLKKHLSKNALNQVLAVTAELNLPNETVME